MLIITTWQRILPKETVKCFRKCCKNNVMERTDDDMLWYSSKEDGNVRSGQEEGGLL